MGNCTCINNDIDKKFLNTEKDEVETSIKFILSWVKSIFIRNKRLLKLLKKVQATFRGFNYRKLQKFSNDGAYKMLLEKIVRIK